jgi:hypothetical protein
VAPEGVEERLATDMGALRSSGVVTALVGNRTVEKEAIETG